MCFRRQHCCFHSLLQWEIGRQAWKQAQLWCQCEEQTLKVTAHDCDLQQPRVSENTGHMQQLIWNTYCHPIRNSCKHTEINLVVFSYQLLLYWLQSGRSRVHVAIWMNDGQKSLIPTLLHNQTPQLHSGFSDRRSALPPTPFAASQGCRSVGQN